MKGKDDADSDCAGGGRGSSIKCSGKNSATLDSSLSSFMQQEKLCKELYLKMGVHPKDIADTSDDDVASILEQMSRLHPSAKETDDSSERNIDDILREAECLLDGQQAHLQSRSKSSSISSRSESEASGTSDQRFLTSTNLVHSSSLGLESDSKQPRFDHFGAESSTLASLLQNQQEKFVPPHLVGTPLEATYKRIYEQIRKEVDGTLKPQLTGDFPDLRLSLPVPGLDTPSFDVPGCFNLEQEFLEERKRCLKLKADLDWLKKQHEREVAELRRRHEGQLNHVREELSTTTTQDPSIALLQSEIKAQERIISSYQDENEKMCAEMKDIKETLALLRQQAGDQSRAKKEAEAVRLRAELAAELRPSLELELRPRLEREARLQLEKEAALERERAQARAQDLERQVRELEGIVRKRQLQTQSSSDLPCSSPARERQLQLQLEQLQRDLEVRRAAERQAHEQAQAADRQRDEQLQALQRQLAERRAAERQLQEQLQAAEEQLQERHSGASKVQAHLQTVKAKYEDLVSSLEQQLTAAHQEIADLRDKGGAAVASSASSEAGDPDPEPQRDEPRREKAAPPKRRPRRSQSVGEPSPCLTPSTGHPPPAPASTTASTEILVMPHQQNRPAAPQRPDTHLLATIRGLQHEMQTKEKEMAKLNRELSDARATNRRLQQERQRLLNEASPLRPKQQQQQQQAAAPVDADTLAENRGLRRDVQRLQEDLLSLHAKRVNDLTRLQAKHEEELEAVVCERVNERLSDRSCEGRVAELQGQLYTQQLVIAHLKDQLKHSEHGGEEVALLKRERDQLEKSVSSLNKQVSRLKEDASPDARRVAALQDQVDELEARHESRERKLQAIVRDLLQGQQQQGQQQGGEDEACCSASVRLLHKNRDLCFYRAQMDRLLDSLRELERSRRGSSS